MAILTCKDLCFAYDGSTVLEGVNFSLNAGNYLCVVGENGSGLSPAADSAPAGFPRQRPGGCALRLPQLPGPPPAL